MIGLGCAPNKITILHSAIDCEKFSFKPRTLEKNEPITIISTGRWIEKKGFEYALEAIATLLKKRPLSIEYTLIGGGPLKQKYQNLIENYDLQKNVKLIDWCTHDELVKYLDNAHIFLLPSVTAKDGNQEGIPNALKEAMATGLPVISTGHAGIPELIVDGQSGFLAPERNATILAEKIELLIDHPELWPAMGKSGRKKVLEEFELNKENDKLEKILLALVYAK